MKFRFKPEDFNHEMLQLPPSYLPAVADRANALLQAEEAKCLQCKGSYDSSTKKGVFFIGAVIDSPNDTHTALLWSVEKIEDE